MPSKLIIADCVDPSTSNAAQIQQTVLRLDREHSASYELAGNRLSRNDYNDLPLPCTVIPPMAAFPRAGYTRLDWDWDGVLSDPDHFFLGDEHVTLDKMEEAAEHS